MNTKNFLVSGLVAGIVDFLLGWLFYGMLFPDLYPKEGEDNILFIALGCLFFGFLLAYIYTVVASIVNAMEGLKVGAVFGLLYSVSMNLFMNSSVIDPNYQNMATDVVIGIVMTAIMGAAIGLINGKMK